jgi:hypothetical protein
MKNIINSTVVLFLFLTFTSSCSESERNSDLNYFVKDSLICSHYAGEIDTIGILYLDEAIIDTIWLFGLSYKALRDSDLVYQKVEVFEVRTSDSYDYNSETYFKETYYEGGPGEYIFHKDNEIIYLSHYLPLFDCYHSSPTIIGDEIYYWGIIKEGEFKPYHIYALRFNLYTYDFESVLLGESYLETESSNCFWEPFFQNGKCVYVSFEHAYEVDFQYRKYKPHKLKEDELYEE